MATAQPSTTLETAPIDLPTWAREFIPTLRAGQSESDRQAKIPQEILEQLEAAGIYKMTIPKAYGGLETDATTWMKTVIELGRGDGPYIPEDSALPRDCFQCCPPRPVSSSP